MITYKTLTLVRAKELFDYDNAVGLRWKISFPAVPAGALVGNIDILNEGYRRCKVAGKRYLVHRLTWFYCYEELPPAMIDHINGDRSDNRLSNLRSVDNSQNQWNRGIGKNNKSGIKGVFYRSPWAARIKIRGRAINLGYFETKEEAASAYQAAAERLQGEFMSDAPRLASFNKSRQLGRRQG